MIKISIHFCPLGTQIERLRLLPRYVAIRRDAPGWMSTDSASKGLLPSGRGHGIDSRGCSRQASYVQYVVAISANYTEYETFAPPNCGSRMLDVPPSDESAMKVAPCFGPPSPCGASAAAKPVRKAAIAFLSAFVTWPQVI